MAMRSKFLHLSFKSTAVRCSMAGKPSFLMSAHLPPPHRATPSTSASASSKAQGLWCLLRRPFAPTPSRPRGVAFPVWPRALLRPRLSAPREDFTGDSPSESLWCPGPLRFLLAADTSVFATPPSALCESEDPRLPLRPFAAFACRITPRPVTSCLETDARRPCAACAAESPAPKKSVCVPAEPEPSVKGLESPASSLPSPLRKSPLSSPPSYSSLPSPSRASYSLISARRRSSHWRLFELVSLPNTRRYRCRSDVMEASA
mmetsp:Transcript_5637/g.23891  ORF Transcript_5637/g.23891 Transcript_5637/m.23891 type:complete len:261 (+) Transcript_5637:2092-2874(+)